MARALIFVPKTVRRGEPFEVRTLVAHPMETGQRSDGAGGLVPADIVRRVECRYAGELVFAADLHPAIAANPLLTFHLVADASGALEVTWTGDRGFMQRETAAVSVEG